MLARRVLRPTLKQAHSVRPLSASRSANRVVEQRSWAADVWQPNLLMGRWNVGLAMRLPTKPTRLAARSKDQKPDHHQPFFIWLTDSASGCMNGIGWAADVWQPNLLMGRWNVWLPMRTPTKPTRLTNSVGRFSIDALQLPVISTICVITR